MLENLTAGSSVQSYSMFGFSTLDLLVIAAYSVLMVAIGWLAMHRVKDQEDFFLGGRRFGKLLQTFASFGQSTSSESAVGTVTTTYRDGAGGIWSHLILLWATPVYWFAAPWYRRMRLLTLGDFFHERYQSRAMAMVYSIIASFLMITLTGLALKAVSATLMGITLKPVAALTPDEQAEYAKALRLETLSKMPWASATTTELEELDSLRHQMPRREFSYFNETSVVWFIILLVFIYGIAGGLKAAVWADSVQGTLILVLSFILIPFAIVRLNGLHGVHGLTGTGRVLHSELPGHFFSVLGSAQNADFTWYYIAVLSVMATLNVAVQSNQLTANASARDELSARVGFMSGVFLKRFCTVLWGVAGLLAFALYGREIQNSDLVWGHATHDLLGRVGLGLVGLVVACLLSALQAAASTMMLSASSLLTRNVYAPLVAGRTESHYLFVGRVAGALVLIASALLCISYGTILQMLKFYWEYNALVAAAFWCGLKWRRATRAGAWASITAAFALFIAFPAGLPLVFQGLRTAPSALATTRERRVTQQYAATLHDVEQRQNEIQKGQGTGAAQAPLRVGEPVTRVFTVPPRSIYWAQGIREVDGVRRGEGMFYPEMYALGQLVDLTANPNALNETIRCGFRILVPFLVVIGVSLLTRRDDSEEVRRFFLRMRTKVVADRAKDREALQAAYGAPDSTRGRLLLPNTELEFFKWDKEDAGGFFVGCIVAGAVVGLLYLVLSIGA
jgi:SSS family solute:Na+ symporter